MSTFIDIDLNQFFVRTDSRPMKQHQQTFGQYRNRRRFAMRPTLGRLTPEYQQHIAKGWKATITVDRSRVEKEVISPELAFNQSTPIVIKRDAHICQYCQAPAAHADQWKDELPSPNNMVACCLSCRIEGKGHFFLTLDEKRAWILAQDA